MAINMVKLPTQKQDLVLRVAKGHFATSHSHINYYIDVTMQKTRLSEARAVALELVSSYTHTTIVDTILCLDGTEVIGACMASELTRDGYVNMNAHQTMIFELVTDSYTRPFLCIGERAYFIGCHACLAPSGREAFMRFDLDERPPPYL